MTTDSHEYLTTREAERYCRLGGFAKRRCTGNNSPPYIRVGGRVLYERAQLDKFLRERTFLNTSGHSAAQAMADADVPG